MSKFSNVPWHIGGRGNADSKTDNEPPRIWGSDRAAVAEICIHRFLGEKGPSAEESANAHLIAAAPDLLAARSMRWSRKWRPSSRP